MPCLFRLVKPSTRLSAAVVVCLFFQVAGVARGGDVAFVNDLNIRLYCETASVQDMRELLLKCEKKLDKSLPRPPRRKTRWLTLFMLNPGEKPPSLAPMGRNVVIKSNASADMIVFCCLRGLISRRLEEPDKTRRYNDWIAAAIVYDILHARDENGMLRPNYRVINNVLTHGAPPSPGELVRYSISPEFPNVFLLFATWSHMVYTLLDALPAGKVSALIRFSHMINEGTSPEKAWAQTWRICETGNQTSTQWLTEQSRGLVNRYSQDQKDGADVMSELSDILKVAVLTPGPDGEMEYRKIPIRRLRSQLPETRLDNQTLQIMEKKIFSLLKRVPLPLQHPLANYMAAIQEREKGLKWKKFLTRIENAETDLEGAMERYRGILVMLDDLEDHYGSPAGNLGPAVRVSVEEDARTRSLDPDITRFLDRFSNGIPAPDSP